MNLRRHHLLGVSAAFAVAIFLAGCSAGLSAGQSESSVTPVRTPDTPEMVLSTPAATSQSTQSGSKTAPSPAASGSSAPALEAPGAQSAQTVTSSPGKASAAPVEVRVTLTEFGIHSSLSVFRVGVPYHFVVTNDGCATHELMVMQPIDEPTTPAPGYAMGGSMYGGAPMGPGGNGGAPGAAMYCDGSGMPWSAMFPNEVPMSQLDRMALATVEDDDLRPGKTATLDLTFTRAYPAGTLEFACHLPGHYELGMRLPVTVS